MQVKDLKANPKNPRKISVEKLDMLRESLAKYGDLSGFVYNRRSKMLVSGHQRQKSIPKDSKITIEVKHETPTQAMTVAEGFVQIGSERFKYREVDADPKWEAEAMLSANKHGGDWDNDIIKILAADIPGLDLKSSGFIQTEIKELNIPQITVPSFSSPPPEEEQTDEQYVASTPETSEQIRTETIPSMAVDSKGAFDSVEEKTESKLTRHLIIIDCPSLEIKTALREKLRADKFDEQHGVKLF